MKIKIVERSLKLWERKLQGSSGAKEEASKRLQMNNKVWWAIQRAEGGDCTDTSTGQTAWCGQPAWPV